MDNLPTIFNRSGFMPSLFRNDFMDSFFEDFNRMFDSCCYETDEGACIYELEVPGFNKDNLDVEISKGVLTISGEREVSGDSYAGKRKVFKQLQIGEIDEDEVEAQIADGILRLTVKRKDFEKEETKKIAIS
jgi:HSP20 family protein